MCFKTGFYFCFEWSDAYWVRGSYSKSFETFLASLTSTTCLNAFEALFVFKFIRLDGSLYVVKRMTEISLFCASYYMAIKQIEKKSNFSGTGPFYGSSILLKAFERKTECILLIILQIIREDLSSEKIIYSNYNPDS